MTQTSVLRLLTTAAAMNQNPLGTGVAWSAYERFFEDNRVEYVPEPAGVQAEFRNMTERGIASPKVWGGCLASRNRGVPGGRVATSDQRMATQSDICLILP